jgi:DNA processing protein
VATWEDVWEELPPDVRLALEPANGAESQTAQAASLLGATELSPHERKIMALLKPALLTPDEARHIDDIIEGLEPQLSSSEIFAALFELQLAGELNQLRKAFSCNLPIKSRRYFASSLPFVLGSKPANTH